jgi:hypothetical protein
VSELVEVEPEQEGDSDADLREYLKNKCFKWHEDAETGKRTRGRWDVGGAGRGVREGVWV